MKSSTDSLGSFCLFISNYQTLFLILAMMNAFNIAYAQIRGQDSLALVDLYYATNGEGWENNTRWLSERTVSTWYGVFIHQEEKKDGWIDRLILDYNLMSGQLPESIGNLDSLEELGLYWNKITGPVPASIGNLVRLKDLRLAKNKFTEIPNEISNLYELTKLDLDGNLLEWLPFRISDLYQLKTLTVNENKLSSLPETITLLFDLERLELNKNQLLELPPDIGYLSELKYLYINKNQLTELPQSLADCKKLVHLDAYGNKLNSLPAGLSELPNLLQVHVHKNQLDFGDLEPLGLRKDLSLFTYYGQENNIKLRSEDISGTKRYVFPVGGDSTVYQWYVDDHLVQKTKDSFFIPAGVVTFDAQLSCVASNKYLSGLIFKSDSVEVSGSLIINSVRDLPLDPEAPDGTCSTGEMIMVDGKEVPECSMRAAFEMVNKQASDLRTRFLIDLQNGERIVPLSYLPTVKYPIELKAIHNPVLSATILNLDTERSFGILYEENNDLIIDGLTFEDFNVALEVYKSDGGKITNCDFNNNYIAVLANESNDYLFTKNKVNGGGVGFRITDGQKLHILQNEIRTDSIGIFLRSTDQNTIDQNRIQASESGVGIALGGGSYNQVKRNSISGNRIGFSMGTYYNETRQNIIEENFFYNNGTNIFLDQTDYSSREKLNNVIRFNHIGINELGIPSTNDSIGIQVFFIRGTQIEHNVIGYQKKYGIYLINAHESNIVNNTIGSESAFGWNGKIGIHAIRLQNLTIENNVISGNKGFGIQTNDVQGIIMGNFIGTNRNKDITIPNLEDGIHITTFNGVIENNSIYGNQGNGIYIESGKITIRNNEIGKSGFNNLGNQLDGIHINNDKSILRYPNLDRKDPVRLRIEGNAIEGNDRGIYALSKNDQYSEIVISSNTISNNKEGVYINNIISSILGNTVEYNYDSGIKISGQPTDDPYIVSNNHIRGNGGGTGVHLTNADAYVQNNMITEDETDGILAEGSCAVNIYRNNIEDNQGYGLNNQDNDQAIQASKNWWGDSDGPGGDGPGSGDKVSTNIIFTPWSKDKIGVCISSDLVSGAMPAGALDSIQLFYQNWNEPMGVLNVEVIDELGWVENTLAPYSVILDDSMGAFEWMNIHIPGLNDVQNNVRIVASSVSNPDDRDTLVLSLSSSIRTPSHLLLAPDSAYVDPGDTVQLYVNTYDQFFADTIIDYSFYVQGGVLSEDDIFTAGDADGIYQIIAYNAEYDLADSMIIVIGNISTSVVPSLIEKSDPIEFSVIPNPSNGQFMITYSAPRPTAISVQVIDLMGSLRYQSDIFEVEAHSVFHFPMDLYSNYQSLGAQVYLVRLITDYGQGVQKIWIE